MKQRYSLSFTHAVTKKTASIGRVPFFCGGNQIAYAVTELGMPELLLAGQSIIIPENSQPTLSVIGADYQLVENFKLIPSKGVIFRNTNPEDVPYQFGAAYQQNAFQRESPAQLTGTFYMRGFQEECRFFVGVIKFVY